MVYYMQMAQQNNMDDVDSDPEEDDDMGIPETGPSATEPAPPGPSATEQALESPSSLALEQVKKIDQRKGASPPSARHRHNPLPPSRAQPGASVASRLRIVNLELPLAHHQGKHATSWARRTVLSKHCSQTQRQRLQKADKKSAVETSLVMQSVFNPIWRQTQAKYDSVDGEHRAPSASTVCQHRLTLAINAYVVGHTTSNLSSGDP